ncbi:MAG: NAD(P)/FAD-dependent oxidoreductase, partial [Syntrophomonadaceae bacterium]|nr:NAD(P)/FAD-dependent oxidoreductase [Syntrophomonadaceae bacterium]
DNYLGLPAIKGEELLDRFMQHAKSMNIEITSIKAGAINEDAGKFSILVGDEIIQSMSIIIATGIPYKPTLPQEEKFLGRGLGYCATCDGPIYRGKDVLLIGHSSEALHEANFMAEICSKVYFLPLYKETGSIDSRVEIVKSKPVEIMGNDFVEGLKLADGNIIKVEGLFVLGGETAPDRLIPGLEIEDKHIKVNRRQETNLAGVYAAGDCTGTPYQVAKSIGEGQVAGLNASKYVSAMK